MASIASKNLFDLLGNDPELDPDRAPEPPTKAIDKTAPRSGKRNAGAEAPASVSSRGGNARGGSRGGSVGGNEQAFRDRNAGSYQNRANPPQEGERGDFRGRGRGGPRGGRGAGGRGGRGRDDRHSKTGIAEHEKQAGHGWGYNSGPAELTDEKAGEALAKDEEKEGFDSTVPPPVNAEGDAWVPDTSGDTTWAPDTGAADAEPAAPAEPEIVTKSYDEHLAEIAEKKLQLGNQPSIRKPNEGASKKFPEGKAFSRDEEENFIDGSGGKAKRERAKKEKNKDTEILKEIDPRQFLAPDKQESSAGRGGRGRGRGDRGGERGSFRGRGRGGGGDRGRGDRPDFRGGRGPSRGGGANVNVDDTSAFPSLGS